MIKTLILICSTLLPREDCNVDTARAVFAGPDVVVCNGASPQAFLASTSLHEGIKAGREYPKMICSRPQGGGFAVDDSNAAAQADTSRRWGDSAAEMRSSRALH